MKTLLKILLISTSLLACQNAGDSNQEATDTSRSAAADALSSDPSSNGSGTITLDPEMEKRKKLTDAILFSKQAVNLLKSEVSDSLTKSGLSPQKRSLFSKTIQQLEESSDLLNKQLESILVADLQSSRNKLNGIVKKMRDSQQELSVMVGKLDKITGYLEMVTTLVESLSPVKSPPSKTAKK
jgi:hypothetical protein